MEENCARVFLTSDWNDLLSARRCYASFVIDSHTLFKVQNLSYTLMIEVPYCIWKRKNHRNPWLTGLKNWIFGFVNMTSIQLEGYERQRAIAGNTFESIPQVLLSIALMLGAFGPDAVNEVGTITPKQQWTPPISKVLQSKCLLP